VPDQQQANIAARWQPRPAVIRVESLALAFDVAVEIVVVEDLMQPGPA
jgi:hypothetical protein